MDIFVIGRLQCWSLLIASYSMLYREALKTGFFDLQAARDRYRELTAPPTGEQMHRDLLLRFIEVQALLLAPIAPHFSEYVWTKLLKKEKSVMHARWPEVGHVDERALRAGEYLQDASHRFRLAIQKQLSKPKALKPSVAKIFVAKSSPSWHSECIHILKPLFDRKSAFPEDQEVIAALKSKPELCKLMKKVMPFVGMIRERVAVQGAHGFDLSMPFDEEDVLRTEMKYLERSLNVMKIDIQPVDPSTDEKAPAIPGEPAITFE